MDSYLYYDTISISYVLVKMGLQLKIIFSTG